MRHTVGKARFRNSCELNQLFCPHDAELDPDKLAIRPL